MQLFVTTKNRKRGRPRKNHERVVLWLAPEVRKLMVLGADHQDITQSEFVSRAISKEFKRLRTAVGAFGMAALKD